jgi:RNA-directed DNA polymerase
MWQSRSSISKPAGTCSPLLANIFLHYALDLWVQRWRRRYVRGRVSIVRFADDFVMGFQHGSDGRKMLVVLRERMAKFKLTLNENKTRLLEFGRLPAMSRKERGQRRPGTFAFLGFTHYCAWSRDGRFVVKRRTDRKRVSRKLRELRAEAKRRMHVPVVDQHRWLCSVLRGHYAYYGLRGNMDRLQSFYEETRRIWFWTLRRRSQRRLSWPGFVAILVRFPLPTPRISASCGLAG